MTLSLAYFTLSDSFKCLCSITVYNSPTYRKGLVLQKITEHFSKAHLKLKHFSLSKRMNSWFGSDFTELCLCGRRYAVKTSVLLWWELNWGAWSVHNLLDTYLLSPKRYSHALGFSYNFAFNLKYVDYFVFNIYYSCASIRKLMVTIFSRASI